MEAITRYHILEDGDHDQVMIVDVVANTVQRPKCWQDIAAYYHYLLDRNRIDEAQTLLAEAMSGTKPMTRMVHAAGHPAPEEGGDPAAPGRRAQDGGLHSGGSQ